MSWLAGTLLVVGFAFILAGVIGILRLPDFYTRLHAVGKCDTLGVGFMVGALAVLDGSHGLSLTSLKILLLVLFIGIGSPTFTHALGRAAIRAGRAPWLREDRR